LNQLNKKYKIPTIIAGGIVSIENHLLRKIRSNKDIIMVNITMKNIVLKTFAGKLLVPIYSSLTIILHKS